LHASPHGDSRERSTKHAEKFSLSVDRILLIRVVRENRFSIDLSRHWREDLRVGGERAQMDGGAIDNQTQLIHYMRTASVWPI
jgi:hypothetical protein